MRVTTTITIDTEVGTNRHETFGDKVELWASVRGADMTTHVTPEGVDGASNLAAALVEAADHAVGDA